MQGFFHLIKDKDVEASLPIAGTSEDFFVQLKLIHGH